MQDKIRRNKKRTNKQNETKTNKKRGKEEFPVMALIVTLAVVTLQAFTRGKSFYLGKISLGKFTSGFIFPWLKGHTGDHWIKF